MKKSKRVPYLVELVVHKIEHIIIELNAASDGQAVNEARAMWRAKGYDAACGTENHGYVEKRAQTKVERIG